MNILTQTKTKDNTVQNRPCTIVTLNNPDGDSLTLYKYVQSLYPHTEFVVDKTDWFDTNDRTYSITFVGHMDITL
ncbi:hypothetical protein UFOVP185_22 [uncultured Caudovirales phage]|uniref:Uncharacterized protein n=1 Tax=uncultured Caudovirales phage TaxID=2100421 RepID=A0A6J7WJC3_9CAUD|nr:hypothetical protein UFOVP185_22 [uncultured Caudovirales phage]